MQQFFNLYSENKYLKTLFDRRIIALFYEIWSLINGNVKISTESSELSASAHAQLKYGKNIEKCHNIAVLERKS